MPFKDAAAKKRYDAKYRKRNRKRIRAWKRSWCLSHEDKRKAARRREKQAFKRNPQLQVEKTRRARERRSAIRLKALAAYGGCCKCCGEREPMFLGFDHIRGGGRRHRQKVGGTLYGFYGWLLKRKRTTIRVLCHNCNLALGFYGRCPHE